MPAMESAEITALRETVCALHAELVRNGLVAWTSGNVSARLADSELMVIKPSGVSYDDLTPESMVACDLDGKPVAAGGLSPSSDTARALEGADHSGRSQPARRGGRHDHRIGHRWGRLSSLSRTGTVPQAAGRRRRRNGQFVGAQSPGRTSANRSQRCQTALPAALLTRFQSDREGLVEAEAVAPRRQSSHCRGLGTSRRRSPQGHHRRECCRLVSAMRLWYTANRKSTRLNSSHLGIS